MSPVSSPGQSPQKPGGGSGGSSGGSSGRGGRKQPKPKPMAMMGMGLEFGAVIAVFCLLGWWIDGWLNTTPWVMLALIAVAAVGGMYKLWRFGQRYFE